LRHLRFKNFPVETTDHTGEEGRFLPRRPFQPVQSTALQLLILLSGFLQRHCRGRHRVCCTHYDIKFCSVYLCCLIWYRVFASCVDCRQGSTETVEVMVGQDSFDAFVLALFCLQSFRFVDICLVYR